MSIIPKAASVHIISNGYDIVYSIDDEDDVEFVKRVLERCLQKRNTTPAEKTIDPAPTT